MNIQIGKEYFSGNTFSPAVETVVAATETTVTVYRAWAHRKIRRVTLARYVWEATRYETAEQMAAAYAAKAA
jgi:hypothetical protein